MTAAFERRLRAALDDLGLDHDRDVATGGLAVARGSTVLGTFAGNRLMRSPYADTIKQAYADPFDAHESRHVEVDPLAPALDQLAATPHVTAVEAVDALQHSWRRSARALRAAMQRRTSRREMQVRVADLTVAHIADRGCADMDALEAAINAAYDRVGVPARTRRSLWGIGVALDRGYNGFGADAHIRDEVAILAELVRRFENGSLPGLAPGVQVFLRAWQAPVAERAEHVRADEERELVRAQVLTDMQDDTAALHHVDIASVEADIRDQGGLWTVERVARAVLVCDWQAPPGGDGVIDIMTRLVCRALHPAPRGLDLAPSVVAAAVEPPRHLPRVAP